MVKIEMAPSESTEENVDDFCFIVVAVYFLFCGCDLLGFFT